MSRPIPFARFVPSFTDVAFLMPIVFLFTRLGGARALLGDGDTGWHIRAGEWMLAHRAVPRQDLFSFTRPGEPWFAWEWLSDVGMAWLHRTGGMAAVVLAGILITSLTFALLYRLVRARSANPLVAIAVTLAAVAGSSIHWLARPHLATLLFTVLFLMVLESRRPRRLIWLPPLTVLWANLHAGFFVGILLVAAYGAGEWISAALAPDPVRRAMARMRGRPYGITAVACVAASFANPYFYRLHAHLWQYLAADSHQFRHVVEFLSLSFRHPVAVFFEGMLAAGMAAAFWHLTRRRYGYVLLLAGWGHLALLAARNIPIFLVVAAVPVALAADEWLEYMAQADLAGWARRALGAFRSLAADISATERLASVPAASGLAAALLGVLLYVPASGQPFRAEYDSLAWPAAALEELRAHPDARVFTTDKWGGYLIYRLYPAVRVFVDGRTDFYGDALEQTYLDVLNVRYDWQQTLDRYAIDTVLLPADAPLAGALKESRRWRARYDDGMAIVFGALRPESEPSSGAARLVAERFARPAAPRKRQNQQLGAN